METVIRTREYCFAHIKTIAVPNQPFDQLLDLALNEIENMPTNGDVRVAKYLFNLARDNGASSAELCSMISSLRDQYILIFSMENFQQGVKHQKAKMALELKEIKDIMAKNRQITQDEVVAAVMAELAKAMKKK